MSLRIFNAEADDSPPHVHSERCWWGVEFFTGHWCPDWPEEYKKHAREDQPQRRRISEIGDEPDEPKG